MALRRCCSSSSSSAFSSPAPPPGHSRSPSGTRPQRQEETCLSDRVPLPWPSGGQRMLHLTCHTRPQGPRTHLHLQPLSRTLCHHWGHTHGWLSWLRA
ncbi:hypothetical protein AAFF_G00284990 [Aldrovandia affinis]|uniref:Uncharacterized protein n=1 Tax=Aldrovandia affinis TaxID=143900 RepID=A0AAD7TAA1_9TELE|nr:hypothetical protein AAFF_G00284990 [Aldrovandia affinis]